MDRLTQVHLQQLWAQTEAPCVSFYLPTHRSGTEVLEDPIKLKNLAKRAEEDLIALKMRPPEAKAYLKPIDQLIADQAFWRFRSEGLAVFRAPNFFRTFRIPEQSGELVVVGSRFHTKPLLREFARNTHFHLLAVSRKSVRLLHVTRGHATELALEDAPKNLEDLYQYEDLSKSFQYRKGGSGKREGAAAPSHSGEEEDKKRRADLLRFFRQVDKAVRKAVDDPETPLVWAGVEALFPLYREAGTYPGRVERIVTGKPDHLSNEELVAQAWSVIDPIFAQERERAMVRFDELSGTPRVSANLNVILPAAHQGRVEVLFLAADRERWGVYHEEEHTADLHPQRQAGDSDLLDIAASQCLRNGGQVYCVQSALLPDGNSASGVAAVFRY